MISYDKAISIIQKYSSEDKKKIVAMSILNTEGLTSSSSYKIDKNQRHYFIAKVDGFAINIRNIQKNIIYNEIYILNGLQKQNYNHRSFGYSILKGDIVPYQFNYVVPSSKVVTKNYMTDKINKVSISLKTLPPDTNIYCDTDSNKSDIIIRKYESISNNHVNTFVQGGIKSIDVIEKKKVFILFKLSYASKNSAISYLLHYLKQYRLKLFIRSYKYDDFPKLFRFSLNTSDIVIIFDKTQSKSELTPLLKHLNINTLYDKININPNINMAMMSSEQRLKKIFHIKNEGLEAFIAIHFFIDIYIRNILNFSKNKVFYSILLNNYSKKNYLVSFVQGFTYVNKKNILSTIIMNKKMCKFYSSQTLSNSWILLEASGVIFPKGSIIRISFI
jgi:hypothetical protein